MYIKIIILILLIAIIGFLLYSLYFYKETFENNTLSKKHVPVDVIIPCIPRDTPKLERVLKSIGNQTKLPYKVIIAHSELNDDEASKIEKQHEKLPFKVVVNNTTEKKYAGENRNRGFSSSNQEFISFFDADDEMKPNRLEEIMKVFNNTDSKCVMHLFKKNNLPNEYYNDEDIIKYISKNNSNNIDKNTNFSKLRKNGYEGIFPSLHHGTPSIKKEVFEKVKQSNNPRGQDQDFLFDVFEYFKNSGNVFTIINKPLQTYVPAERQKVKIETFQSKNKKKEQIEKSFINSKYNLAICFSGNLRTFDICIDNIKTNIIDSNKNKFNIKIFAYILNDENSFKKKYLNQYNSVVVLNKDSPLPKLNIIWHNNEKKYSKKHPLKKWLYQLKDVNESFNLVKKYEEENKMTFDFILRIRPDLVYNKPLKLDKYDKSKIIIPNFHSWGGINDRFAFGNRQNMEIYMNGYENLLKYLKSHKSIKINNAEEYCKKNLVNNNIPFKKHNNIQFFRTRDNYTEYIDFKKYK